MNFFQIIGFVLITIGTVISFYGSYQQSKKDDKFQNNVTNFVSDQENLNIPNIKAVRIINAKNYNSAKIVLKNVGKYSATKVSLIYDPNSYPSVFSSNLITQLREITPGEEVEVNLNLFSGINLIEKLPNPDQDFKNSLLSDLQRFKSGSKVFIPKFHIEYFHDKNSIISDQYFLIVHFRDGITAFDKYQVD
jgi:hypothetical protein